MEIKTVYFNFDDGVVTWFHPSRVDWEKVTDRSLIQVYHGLGSPLRKGPVWVVQVRHVALRSARWCLVVGTDPGYSYTVHILRKELSAAII